MAVFAGLSMIYHLALLQPCPMIRAVPAGRRQSQNENNRLFCCKAIDGNTKTRLR